MIACTDKQERHVSFGRLRCMESQTSRRQHLQHRERILVMRLVPHALRRAASLTRMKKNILNTNEESHIKSNFIQAKLNPLFTFEMKYAYVYVHV